MSPRLLLILLVVLVLAGCEEDTPAPIYAGNANLLPYLTEMKRVALSFEAVTVHFWFEKQSSIDPGNKLAIESMRRYTFSNDTNYVIEWTDSGFSTKCNFEVREFDYAKRLFEYVSSRSTLAGYYNLTTGTLRDVRASFKFYEQFGIYDWQSADGSLGAEVELRLERAGADSAVFIAEAGLAAATIAGYAAEERWYGSYVKQTRLESILPQPEPRLRVVFYRK